MASQPRKTYDTDIITLRRIFAYNPELNAPISSCSVLTVTGSRGNASFIDILQISSIREVSTTVGNLSRNISTGNVSLSTAVFIDRANNASQILTVSSGILYLNNIGISGTGNINTSQLVSSIAGLGSAGYISTLSTNQLSTGILKSGDIRTSTVNLIDTVNGGLRTLTSSNDFLYYNGGIINFASITSNVSSYIYQVSSISSLTTFDSLVSVSSATNVYINTNFFSSIQFSTGQLITSSVNFMDITSNTEQLLAVSSGTLLLNNAAIVADLTKQQLFSTVAGLGSIGYISSSQFLSTSDGLITNILNPSLVSTVDGLQTNIFPPFFASTVDGLGIAGYTSNSQLISTTAGIYDSVLTGSNIVSTVAGLGTIGYISSSQLISSIAGTPSLINLVSTVAGLGSAGYISSSQLGSTTSGILEKRVPDYIVSVASVFVSTPSLLSSFSNLFIPFGGNPTSGTFQMFAQSNTLNFGFSGASTSQIFIGDARASNAPGNRDPFIEIVQNNGNPGFTTRQADVLNLLGGSNGGNMIKIDSNLSLGINVPRASFESALCLSTTLHVAGSIYGSTCLIETSLTTSSFFASTCVVRNSIVASNFMITSSLILAHSLASFSSMGPAGQNIRLSLTTGDAIKPTGTTWINPSDKRIKENIVDADYNRCYNDIKALPLRRFNYMSSFINQTNLLDRTVLGFVAQELSPIIPKAVIQQPMYGFNDLYTVNTDQVIMASFGALKKTIYDKECLESTTTSLKYLNEQLQHDLVAQSIDFINKMNAQKEEMNQQFDFMRANFAEHISTLRGEMESMKNDLSMSHSIL